MASYVSLGGSKVNSAALAAARGTSSPTSAANLLKPALEASRGGYGPTKVNAALGSISAAAKQASGQLSTGSAKTASDASSLIQQVQQIAGQNTALSAAQAEQLRKWQEQQNAAAMEFNAEEAAKNRDWQKMMSDTAHQREVKDLMAAGLNPVLSAMGGQGAYTGSGATASGVTSSGAQGEVDKSASAGLVNLLGTLLQTSTQLQQTAMSARSNEAISERLRASNELIARITGDYSLQRQHIAGDYGLRSAGISAKAMRDVETMRESHDTFIHQNYPSNDVQAIIAALSGLFGGSGVSGIISGGKKVVSDVGHDLQVIGERVSDLFRLSNADYEKKYKRRSGSGAGRK